LLFGVLIVSSKSDVSEGGGLIVVIWKEVVEVGWYGMRGVFFWGVVFGKASESEISGGLINLESEFFVMDFFEDDLVSCFTNLCLNITSTFLDKNHLKEQVVEQFNWYSS